MPLARLLLNFMIKLIPPGTKLTIITEAKDYLDLYGKTFAYVNMPNGSCVNEIMVAEGYAKPHSRLFIAAN